MKNHFRDPGFSTLSVGLSLITAGFLFVHPALAAPDEVPRIQIQRQGVAALSITYSATNFTNLIVEQTESLAISNLWRPLSPAATRVSDRYELAITNNGGSRFFRLASQGAAGNTALMKTLAEQVRSAASDETRMAALIQVMRALNIGVYTSSLDVMAAGAERANGDFYLYELEMAMMSRSLARHDTWSLSDMAAGIGSLGILPAGAQVTSPALLSILIEGTHSAYAAPLENSSRLPILVRELGLSGGNPYDLLLDDVSVDVRFDALQRFLILADMGLPKIREAGPVKIVSNLPAVTGGMVSRVSAASIGLLCKEIGNLVKEGWATGVFLAGLSPKYGPHAVLAGAVIDGLHGSLMAYGVEVTALDPLLTTHYGHKTAGKELKFRVQVQMLDDLPTNVVNCGWLAGVEFPKKGPIEGVRVVWSTGELSDHGKLSCGAACNSETGPDGIATLVFTPKDETHPGIGLEEERRGLVEGVALYQTKLKNTLGGIAQVLTPKSGLTPWAVRFHKTPVFELSFDSTITGAAQGLLATSTAQATLTMSLAQTNFLTGSGTMKYKTQPLAAADGCMEPFWRGDSAVPFRVLRGDVRGDPTMGETPAISLLILPGQTTEILSVVCPLGSTSFPGASFWSAGFHVLHQAEFAQGGWLFEGWTYVGSGSVFARKTVPRTSPDFGIADTTLILKLIP